jgi:hypothetical protein
LTYKIRSYPPVNAVLRLGDFVPCCRLREEKYKMREKKEEERLKEQKKPSSPLWTGGKKTPSRLRYFTYYITPSRTGSLNERNHIHARRNQFTWVGKNGTRVSRALLIVVIELATTGPPMWSLNAISLFRVILFGL